MRMLWLLTHEWNLSSDQTEEIIIIFITNKLKKQLSQWAQMFTSRAQSLDCNHEYCLTDTFALMYFI